MSVHAGKLSWAKEKPVCSVKTNRLRIKAFQRKYVGSFVV